MARRAVLNDSGEALMKRRLKIVDLGRRRRQRVRTPMADRALHARVSDGVLEEFARLLELEPRPRMTVAAAGLIRPRLPLGIADRLHPAVTVDTRHASREMNVTMALCTHAGMARVTVVLKVNEIHAVGVRTMHGR